MTDTTTVSDRAHPLAATLCLFGFFLHIALSDPLLLAMGFHYSGEGGQFLEKIHPGSWFIFLSLGVLLLRGGNPLGTAYALGRGEPAASALFTVCVLMLCYVVARSGMGGTAFLIDTHLTVPICAMVLCHAPVGMCRRALHLFVAVAALNSAIGIAEAIGRVRLLPFDPDWVVLHEEYFRSSAIRGHPLNNAMMTAIALFTLLAMRYRLWLTLLLSALMLASLVAFGGRAALLFSVPAWLLWGGVTLRHAFTHATDARRRLALSMLAALMPLLLLAILLALLASGVGERLASVGWWDKSAASRLLAPMVFDFMTREEIVFGVSMDRIMEITDQVNQVAPISYIENPWLLMFMALGAVMFPLWLAATLIFVRRLMRGQSLAAVLAVLAYFLIASTSNSFGRKDSTYLIMVCAVVCLAQRRRAEGT